MNHNDLAAQDNEYIANTYKRVDVDIINGKGSTCFDLSGKKYIDFTSGIGVNSLGYCNSDWSRAVCNQAQTLNHTGNYYYTQPQAALAEKLTARTDYSKVFFANSGAEANECAIKIARKHSVDKYGKHRNCIISLVNSFHGRTVTTLSATGQDQLHQHFFPFTAGFKYAQANDIEDLKSKLDDSVCGIMCELIQGEGGVIPLEQDYVKQITQICHDNSLTLIVDEIQTGIGRTGKLLCAEHYKIKPNIITLAKGLGGGLPIGAVLMDSEHSSVLSYGDHGSTFGGNPIVCAGAEVVIDKINEDFLCDVTAKGKRLYSELSKCKEVETIAGMGLMIGLHLKSKSAAYVMAECASKGLLVLTAKDRLRLLPSLNINDDELSEGMRILMSVLDA